MSVHLKRDTPQILLAQGIDAHEGSEALFTVSKRILKNNLGREVFPEDVANEGYPRRACLADTLH